MPNLVDLQLRVVENVLGEQMDAMHTAIPAIVSSYDHATQTATLQIAVNGKMKRRNAQGYVEMVDRPVPLIPNVPVAFFSTGTAAITRKLVPGDVGLAIFCDQALNEWKATGGRGKANVSPQHVRRFDLSDAIFLPGVRPKADALPADALSEDALVVYDEERLELRAPEIRAGGTEPVAMAGPNDDNWTALAGTLSAWASSTPTVATLVSAIGGLLATGWPHTTAATKLKAE